MRNNLFLLASTSKFRKKALANAGISIELAPSSTMATDADENDFKSTISHLSPRDQAEAISAYKGLRVSQRIPEAWVLSGDQIAAVGNEVFNKPQNKDTAKKDIIKLSGKIIDFHTAITLCFGGNIVWQYMEKPSATHKKHTAADADIYLSKENPVGCAGSVLVESQHADILIKTFNGSVDALCGMPINALHRELIRLKIMSDT